MIWKWSCSQCGYNIEGEESPEECLRCGANKESFYQAPYESKPYNN